MSNFLCSLASLVVFVFLVVYYILVFSFINGRLIDLGFLHDCEKFCLSMSGVQQNDWKKQNFLLEFYNLHLCTEISKFFFSECFDEEFSCGDSAMTCIANKEVCDGDVDCPNSADEQNCC